MARRTQKNLESLARELAHRNEDLSNFERRLFWTRLLSQQAPARALALMGMSTHSIDRDYFGRAMTAGHAAARLAATVDLAIASIDAQDPPISTEKGAARGHDIFVWHDWPSFEMDLQNWLTALPQAELRRELKQRIANGLQRSTAEEIARIAACGDL